MHRILLILLTAAAAASAQSPAWKLAWSDEFDGPANTAPDASKWGYDIGHGGNGWGNHELQTYTKSIDNAHLDGESHLVIRAQRTESGEFTSARLKTLGKFAASYGKIEARIKIPYGQGIWPAFWAMGADIVKVGWPKCGEIDIMENIGKEPGIQHGSVHGPGYSDGGGPTGAYTLPKGAKLSDDFHTYAIVWSKNSVEFVFDGHSYFNVTPATIPAGKTWIFDKLLYLLLNVAVGGDWPGSPDESSIFPQEMVVDYVRVYEPAAQ